MSSSQLSQCDTRALQRFSVFVCASSLRSLPQTVASAPKPNCRAVPCNGNGPCPSRLIAGQRCVRRSARVAAGPWYNVTARLTSNSEIVKRVGGTESPLAQSDTDLLQGRTGHRLQHVCIRGMKGTMSKVHCHLYVSWLQPTKDFTGASTMEPPGVLGHPSHCELHLDYAML